MHLYKIARNKNEDKVVQLESYMRTDGSILAVLWDILVTMQGRQSAS